MAGHKRNFGGSNDIRSGRNEFGNVHFGGSNDIRSGRNEFGNVHFGGSNAIQSGRNEFNNVFFRGDREVDHNKTRFNRSGAFDDGASYFRGSSPDTFAYAHDRNIVYNASGCGQMNDRGRAGVRGITQVGGSTADRQTGSGCISGGCGSGFPSNYNCYDSEGNNNGCGCSDKAKGVCIKGGGGARVYTDAEIMDDIRRSGRKVPRTLVPKRNQGAGATADRQIGEPEECRGGSSPALGVYCPKGCECWKKRCIPDGYTRKQKEKLFSTQADDPANRRTLNAAGRLDGFAEREVADPTGYGCDSIRCGRMQGGGRLRCPRGCKCKNGFCVSRRGGRLTQEDLLMTRR